MPLIDSTPPPADPPERQVGAIPCPSQIERLPQRIMVYGVTGSGKTTLAKRIAQVTHLPLIDVDEHTWLPGWQSVPDDEQRREFTEICAGERWVLDTAYGKWRDIPLQRVELIVALDYPRWRSLGRLLRRTFLRVYDGRPVCNGNRETLRQTFSRDSIVLWHFKSFRSKRRRIREWVSRPAGFQIVVLTHPREADGLINRLAELASS